MRGLGGVEVDVTVLFADLGGYTAFAERATPTEVVAMLNAVFGAAVPVVLGEGGAVVQFMGDAMMAIFNAPRPQPDHALREHECLTGAGIGRHPRRRARVGCLVLARQHFVRDRLRRAHRGGNSHSSSAPPNKDHSRTRAR